VPPEATFYEAVRILPAAQTLVLEGGRLTQKPYWSPREGPGITLAGVDYAQELRRRLTAAVECRLRGGKRVAVHLSGGLDSSTVACLAARCLKRDGRRLLALCSLLPREHQGPESDERAYIEAVLAQEENIAPVWVRTPVGMEPFGALTRWFDVLAQPSYSNVTHIEEQLGETGRAHGVDVVLSGFGGDLFASIPGQNAIRELLRAGRWGAALSTLGALHREQGASWPRLLRREILSPLLPSGLRPGQPAGACAGSAHPDLLKHRDARPKRTSAPPLGICSPWEMMRFVLAPGHIERPLAAYTQVFACEFAQEIRFPLLDSRVIEWMLDMPAVQFQLGGWPRSLMRRAMAGILPESIRLRREKGGAFDPAITSRFVAARAGLVRWAEETRDRRCWRYVDRERFLKTLQAVQAAPRGEWRQEFFRIVLSGGIIARFIEWHERGEESPCR
jgi:asparagine synthase (glutamine-hydrolysing)